MCPARVRPRSRGRVRARSVAAFILRRRGRRQGETMKAIALVQPPHEPAMAGTFFGYLLGDGWEVQGFGAQEDVPDDVAAETEFILAALARVDASLIGRCPKLRLIQVPGHGFEHVDVDAARAAGVSVATVASSGAEAHTVAEGALPMAGGAAR